MRLSISATVLLAAGSATAQFEANQTAPFFLKLSVPSTNSPTKSNTSLDGVYLSTCHAGAAISGLCLDTVYRPSPLQSNQVFYFNYSGINTLSLPTTDTSTTTTTTAGNPGVNATTAVAQVGILTHPINIILPDGVTRGSLSQPLDFSYTATSPVAVPLFQPTAGSQTSVGFDGDDRLFIYSVYSDTDFTATDYPKQEPRAYYSGWYVCWTWVGGGYYYRALSWVTSAAVGVDGAVTNPTCVQVGVVREWAGKIAA